MAFKEYIEDLCKQGIIDGNITERIMGLHRDECGSPVKAIHDRLMPILNEMWQWPVSGGNITEQAIHTFADQLDDALSNME